MIYGPVAGEFAGTFVMMVLGGGVNAACSLTRSKAEGSGWLAITTGWAFAVLCGIFTANLFGSPAAYLNPAITIAFAIMGKGFVGVGSLVAAEMVGAFLAATTVWLFYMPHWAVTEDQGTKLGVFCTGPAIRSLGWNVLSEVIGTFVLVLVIGAIGSKTVFSAGAAPGVAPYLVSCVVWSIGLSLGATTGYAINPARDLGPRLAHWVLPVAGKGGSDWSYAWVPVVGPVIGASLAALVLRGLGA